MIAFSICYTGPTRDQLSFSKPFTFSHPFLLRHPQHEGHDHYPVVAAKKVKDVTSHIDDVEDAIR